MGFSPGWDSPLLRQGGFLWRANTHGPFCGAPKPALGRSDADGFSRVGAKYKRKHATCHSETVGVAEPPRKSGDTEAKLMSLGVKVRDITERRGVVPE